MDTFLKGIPIAILRGCVHYFGTWTFWRGGLFKIMVLLRHCFASYVFSRERRNLQDRCFWGRYFCRDPFPHSPFSNQASASSRICFLIWVQPNPLGKAWALGVCFKCHVSLLGFSGFGPDVELCWGPREPGSPLLKPKTCRDSSTGSQVQGL